MTSPLLTALGCISIIGVATAQLRVIANSPWLFGSDERPAESVQPVVLAATADESDVQSAMDAWTMRLAAAAGPRSDTTCQTTQMQRIKPAARGVFRMADAVAPARITYATRPPLPFVPITVSAPAAGRPDHILPAVEVVADGAPPLFRETVASFYGGAR